MTFFPRTIKYLAAVICVATMSAAPWSATAQTSSFTDSQLRSFATAVAAINQIAERWQPQIQAAQTESQAAQMLEQVDVEMRQAIETTEGIGVDEYQTIMAAAQTDPTLKSHIEAFLKEAGAQ
ncbi:MAG: DUF4168 domain-containing protein [Geminicoccaceae bacterium]